VSLSNRNAVLEQYRDAGNLDARVQLHERFSTNTYGWHPWVFDQLGLMPDQRVLEIGCGPGHLWRNNLARLPESLDVTLSDLSEGMLAEARRTIGDKPRFRHVVADAQRLPFDDARFDVVIANHMLYHVPDLPRALAEIRRVLRPEGRFFAAANGEAHLRELGELVAHIAPELVSWAVAADRPVAFTLENGAEQIAHQFRKVELRRYDDALVVTEAEPLLAYVLSGRARSVLDSESIGALAEYIATELVRAGAIRIGKDSGLFIAW
jgi:ubiquinone/menaquinone biosynthesis C-methylase UbiE